jgi:DNA-directed RNA polymerase subunit RPC12/RpoP
MVHVLCGQCGRSINVPDEKAGSRVPCPRCGALVATGKLGHAGEEEEGFASQVREAMNRKVRIVCGKCGRGLRVPLNMAGKSTNCPACSERIRIPYPDEYDEAALPPITPADGPDQEIDESQTYNGDGPDQQQASTAPATAAAPSEQAPQPHAPAKSRRAMLIAAIAGGVVVAALLGILLGLAIVGGPDLPPDDETAADTGGDQPGPGATQGPDQGPAANRANPGDSAPPVHNTAPRGAQARMAVRDTETAYFAADGYYPAGPKSLYWIVTLSVTAGRDGLSLTTFGDAIALRVGGKVITPLGVVSEPGRDVLPRRAEHQQMKLEPQTTRAMRLLFEVPASADAAKIEVRGVGTADVVMIGLPAPPGEGDILGNFAETSPRNLKPLLRGGLAQAFQESPDQSLRIFRDQRNNQLRLHAPNAGANGDLKPLGNGLYEAQLGSRRGRGKVTIRVINGGKGVILYLSDEPFHQMTFLKQD